MLTQNAIYLLQDLIRLESFSGSENQTASKALAIMNEKKVTSLLVCLDRDLNKKSASKLRGIVHIHSLLNYGIK